MFKLIGHTTFTIHKRVTWIERDRLRETDDGSIKISVGASLLALLERFLGIGWFPMTTGDDQSKNNQGSE
jgi:hypothetical protein